MTNKSQKTDGQPHLSTKKPKLRFLIPFSPILALDHWLPPNIGPNSGPANCPVK